MADIYFPSSKTSQMATLAEVEREILLQELKKIDDEIDAVRALGDFYSNEKEKKLENKVAISSAIGQIESQMKYTDNDIHNIWKDTVDEKNAFLDGVEEEQTNRELIDASNDYAKERIMKKAAECNKVQEIIEKLEETAKHMENAIDALKKEQLLHSTMPFSIQSSPLQ